MWEKFSLSGQTTVRESRWDLVQLRLLQSPVFRGLSDHAAANLVVSSWSLAISSTYSLLPSPSTVFTAFQA